ncbi:MAG: phosphoribosylpyrophosphate synthetase [Bacteriovoracaceae bacterium]|nr:phosphoribosylpyrophosphate synthetase [Bacteriovoracaceae bacterium]
MKYLLLIFCALSICSESYAQDKVIIGIRGNEAASRWFAKSTPDSILAEDKTTEFESGTTDVKIFTSLANKSVLIVLPKTFTPNTLMEALIKTRIAKSNGARSIEVYSPVALSSVDVVDAQGARIFLPLPSMFAIAGAEFVNEQGGIRTGLSPENMSLFKKEEPKKSFIFGDDHPELRDELSEILNIPVLKDIKGDLSGMHIFYIAPFMVPANEVLLKQMSVVRYLITKGARIHFVSTCLAYGRADRMNGPGTTVSGALVVNEIEGLGIEGTFIIRAHAAQSEGFFRGPVTHLSGQNTILPYLMKRKVTRIMAPDNGALKESTEIADKIGASIGGVNKIRNKKTKQIKIVAISASYLDEKKVSLRGKVVAMPDDETNTGSTQDEGATRIKKEKRPKEIIAVVIHVTGTAKAAIESKAIQELVVTNTVPLSKEVRDNKKVTVLSIAPELAEALKPFVIANCADRIRKIAK